MIDVSKKPIITALMSAFDKDENLNERGLRQLVRHNLEIGAEGFYVSGSTAEAALMSVSERERSLDIVLDENAGRVPVIAHVGAVATRDVLELARHAREAGVAAISAIPPYYYKFNWREIVGYYYALADAGQGLDVIVYNFPGITGFSMTEDMLAELFRHPAIKGVKHTCSEMFIISRVKAAFPGHYIFNGFDEQLASALVAGADGAIGSTYNVIAPWAIAVRDAVAREDISAAREAQNKINEFVTAIAKIGVNPAIKLALRLEGVDVGHCRRPFMEMGGEESVEYLKARMPEGKK